MAEETMRAVVFKGVYRVEVEDRPVPQIREPTDIIVKVRYTALCGRWVKARLCLLHSTLSKVRLANISMHLSAPPASFMYSAAMNLLA